MTYEFGDYKVKTKHNFFWAFYKFHVSVTYKEYELSSTDRGSEEACLNWARIVIRDHKSA